MHPGAGQWHSQRGRTLKPNSQPGLCGPGSLRKCGLNLGTLGATGQGSCSAGHPVWTLAPASASVQVMGRRARAGSAVTRRNVLEFISFLGLSWGGVETNLLVVPVVRGSHHPKRGNPRASRARLSQDRAAHRKCTALHLWGWGCPGAGRVRQAGVCLPIAHRRHPPPEGRPQPVSQFSDMLSGKQENPPLPLPRRVTGTRVSHDNPPSPAAVCTP